MDESSSFVPTKGSLARNTAVRYQEVSYVDDSNKIPLNSNTASTTSNKQTNSFPEYAKYNQEFDLKKAKREMNNLVRDGLKPMVKQKSLKKLAIELGAIPTPRKAIPYKDLLRRKEKRKRLDKIKLSKIAQGKQVNNERKKRKSKKEKNESLLDIYGKVDS